MRWSVIGSILVLGFVTTLARADAADDAKAAAAQRHKAISIGNVTINAYDIIAVYKPVQLQGVAIYLGRPGHGVQTIILRDNKEAAAAFNELWDNQDVTKDPGEDDNRPLTRMCPKDAERKSATLIANVNRLLAVVWSTDHRQVRVYLDKFLGNEALQDPNGNDPMDALEIQSIHDEAENVMAAYKACVLRK